MTGSVKIVEAGYGEHFSFGAVDTTKSLEEGIHFVVPVRDNVVPMEVRTQKITEDAASASKDLQDVRTQVALNYHINPDNAQPCFQGYRVRLCQQGNCACNSGISQAGDCKV